VSQRSFHSGWWLPALIFLVALAPAPAIGQAPLQLVNDETTVSEISFRFVEGQTFEESRLREEIATTAPGFWARFRNTFSFLPGLKQQSPSFDPLTLQKDVVRLRQFYQKNGFPRPSIDYPASQLDTTDNRIHVIFTIQEGPPRTLREVTFRTADGSQPLTDQLDAPRTRKWRQFQKETDTREGKRYTDFERTRIEDETRTWLRNQGYAFANIQSETQIDSTSVTLRFLVDPGPLARFSEIQIEGNDSVNDVVIRRALPFEEGDRFSAADVTAGQRALFDLSLFRVALADMPDQPRDSTATVRYRVREAKLRAYSGQVGYGTQAGITVDGSWRHRNFRGGGRSLVLGVTAETGFPSNPASVFPFLSDDLTKTPNRLFRTSLTFRQPYLFTERLTGTLEPFVQERRNPTLSPSPDRGLQLLEDLRLNERQFGINTTLVYNLLPFRSVSLQHSFSRTQQFRGTGTGDRPGARLDDLFGKSVFTLSGTFGKADDFINPNRGYILRPTVELGGIPFDSGVEFARGSGEVSGYLPLSDNVEVAGRVFGGFLQPFGESRTNLTSALTAPDSLRRDTRRYQDRFSDVLFYAGGASDVRGWTSQLGGGKVLRDLNRDTASTNYAYRSTGARSKLGVNLEARLPFPGLGDSWRTAIFVDAAYLETGNLNLIPPANVAGIVAGPEGRTVATERTQLLVGAGAGFRYRTPFGFVRLDAAYKLTPDALDLRNPGDVGAKVERGAPPTDAPTRLIRRFRLHFGIGRSF